MPPKKGKKMDLNAFLADETTGKSWADEMDELPTGRQFSSLLIKTFQLSIHADSRPALTTKASGDPNGGSGLGGSHLSRGQGGREGGFGGDRMGGGFDSDRPPRAEVPFPTAPPYTAFVGNLSFEVGEADLESFFTGLSTTSVRLVQGHDMKPKGFGYVEFSTAEDLTNALAMTGQNMDGRTVRISVAEAPKNREGRADEDMTWTRQGPLAPIAGGRSGGFDRPRTEGFGSSAGAGGEEVVRDGPIRGGKFVASAPSEQRRPGGFDRSTSGSGGGGGREGGFNRDVGPREFAPAPMAEVERDGPIRGGKFVASAPAPERRQFGGEERRGPGSAPGPADEEKTWSRQGPLAPIAGARTGGGFGSPRAGGASFGDRTPPTGEQPARQRLQLSARSATPSTEVSPTGSPAPSSRPSPFGNAKPINTAEKEREVEAKLAKDREALQAKLAAEKEKREASGFGAARKAAKPAVVVEGQPPVAAETSKSPEAGAWRTAGGDKKVEEVTKKVEETTI